MILNLANLFSKKKYIIKILLYKKYIDIEY